jgi:hypothetical protein
MLRPTARTVLKKDNMPEFRRMVRELSRSFVKAGFPSSAPVGSPSNSGSGHRPYSDISEIARLAIWLEFGVPKKTGDGWIIPPRPFFRTALENKEKIEDFMDRVAADFLVGKYTAEEALEAVGLFVVDLIKLSIVQGEWTPNAPRTIEEKGSSKPLIDTAQMLNSVTFVKKVGAGVRTESEAPAL